MITLENLITFGINIAEFMNYCIFKKITQGSTDCQILIPNNSGSKKILKLKTILVPKMSCNKSLDLKIVGSKINVESQKFEAQQSLGQNLVQ